MPLPPEFLEMLRDNGVHVCSDDGETCICGERWPCDAWVAAMEEGGF